MDLNGLVGNPLSYSKSFQAMTQFVTWWCELQKVSTRTEFNLSHSPPTKGNNGEPMCKCVTNHIRGVFIRFRIQKTSKSNSLSPRGVAFMGTSARSWIPPLVTYIACFREYALAERIEGKGLVGVTTQFRSKNQTWALCEGPCISKFQVQN